MQPPYEDTFSWKLFLTRKHGLRNNLSKSFSYLYNTHLSQHDNLEMDLPLRLSRDLRHLLGFLDPAEPSKLCFTGVYQSMSCPPISLPTLTLLIFPFPPLHLLFLLSQNLALDDARLFPSWCILFCTASLFSALHHPPTCLN